MFGVRQLIIVGMKIILLSVVLANTCAANNNDTVAKGIANGFLTGAVDNTTDEAGLAPQKKKAFLVINYDGYPFIYDDSMIPEPGLFYLDSPIVTRFMPSFYIIIILISLPLNTLALVTFTCKIKKKKPAVIYMSHLAVVDLLCTLLLPLNIHYRLNSSDWVFGEAACRVVTAAYYCNMYCSILLVMCMSVDRLLAVVFPVKTLTWRTPRKALCLCVIVWLLALAGAAPLLSMELTFKSYEGPVTCLDAMNFDQHFRLCMYMISVFILNYFFLPLVFTLVSYFTIVYVLCVKSDNVASSSSSSSSDKRRRAIIMVIAVVIEFVLCFGPTNGILLYFCVYVATGHYKYSNVLYNIYMLAVCLGSASVFLDPLLYYYGSSQYRKMIRSVLSRSPLCAIGRSCRQSLKSSLQRLSDRMKSFWFSSSGR